MRPVKLTMEGFTSFASKAVIDFRGLDLFAITGHTGAGKSSILDGMLFALFGATPRGVSVGELRTQNAPAMKVELEFAVSDRQFLISRVYRGKNAVQLQLHNWEGEKWKLITSQVRQAEDEVRRVLGLDFDGFTRAVILPQGAFDEFLRGDAATRTRILSDLLSLQLYDSMKTNANSRASALRGETESLEKQLARDFADATPQHRQALAGQIADAEELLRVSNEFRDALVPLEERALALRQLRTELSGLQSTLDADRRRQAERERAAATVRDAIAQTEKKKAQCETDLAASGFDASVFEQLVEVTPLARQAASGRAELSRRRAQIKERTATRTQLQKESEAAEGSWTSAQRSLQQAQEAGREAVAALAAAKAKFGSSDVVERIVRELESATTALGVADPEAEKARLEREVEHLQTQHAAHEIRAHLKNGEPCPVCEQTVAKVPPAAALPALDAARARLRTFQAAHVLYSSCRERAAALGPDPAAVAAHLRALESAEKSAAGQIETLRSQAASAELAARTAKLNLESLDRELRLFDEQIKDATERLRKVGEQLLQFPEWASLPVDEMEANLEEQRAKKERHEALRRDLSAAADRYLSALRESQETQAELLSLERGIQEKAQKASELTKQVAEAARTLAQSLTKLPPSPGDELDRVTKAKQAADQQMQQAGVALGRLQNQLAALDEKLERSRQIRTEIEEKREQERLYKELGLLLNARNFIAYVQRQMLERLAALASEQLATLSSGRYRLTLSGENNDFFVEDHWNARMQRSAKTLSGGESFLASLSLALALSDSVAGFGQNAARLESLFLDEGFSTLDSESLQTAIEAIQVLASSRRMVGVISHLPQLAEQLPARMHVDRSAGSSAVRIERADDHSHSMVAGGL